MKYLLTLCLAFTLAAPARAQDEAFTGKIFNTDGAVEYQKAGTTGWNLIKPPFSIEVGDKVRTGPGSMAEIYVRYGSKIRLGAGTTFLLNKVSKEDNSMTVLVGKMQAWMRKMAGRKFSVRTPTAVCAIRGTNFEVEVAETGESSWNLFTGSLQIFDAKNRSVELASNQRVVVTKEAGVVRPEPLPVEIKVPDEPKKIKEEKEEIKAEKQEAKLLESGQKKEEPKKEAKKEEPEAEAQVEPPPFEEPLPEPAVIPTQIIQESCEVSGSSPACN